MDKNDFNELLDDVMRVIRNKFKNIALENFESTSESFSEYVSFYMCVVQNMMFDIFSIIKANSISDQNGVSEVNIKNCRMIIAAQQKKLTEMINKIFLN